VQLPLQVEVVVEVFLHSSRLELLLASLVEMAAAVRHDM
jgi:hypothetical protein